MFFGAIEAGGTKFVCAVGTEEGKILEKLRVPTTTPETTMREVIGFLLDFHKKRKLTAIGIASFGPLDINRESKNFGMITKTPKIAWQKFNYLKMMQKSFKIPIAINTDVNGSAIGEFTWGAAKGLKTFLYMTVGTGIGVGGMVQGEYIQGLSHSEMGHIYVPIHPKDSYKGVCPIHKNCLEGLASGPSMMKRWEIPSALNLPTNHFGWELEAYYLGLAVTNYILCFSPERVIMGGGVMKNPDLISKVRKNVLKMLNGYLDQKEIIKGISSYIVKPKMKGDQGVLGAIALALNELKQKNRGVFGSETDR